MAHNATPHPRYSHHSKSFNQSTPTLIPLFTDDIIREHNWLNFLYASDYLKTNTDFIDQFRSFFHKDLFYLLFIFLGMPSMWSQLYWLTHLILLDNISSDIWA